MLKLLQSAATALSLLALTAKVVLAAPHSQDGMRDLRRGGSPTAPSYCSSGNAGVTMAVVVSNNYCFSVRIPADNGQCSY